MEMKMRLVLEEQALSRKEYAFATWVALGPLVFIYGASSNTVPCFLYIMY